MQTISLWRVLLCVGLCFQLSACALTGSSTPQNKTFFFDLPLKPLPEKVTSDVQISISPLRAMASLNTSDFHYQHQTQRLEHYAHNRWLDKPTELLLPLLVNQLESSGHFQAVLAHPQAPLRARYRLDTELLQLHQDFTETPSQFKLAVRSQLFDLTERRILGTHLFNEQLAANSDDASGGAVAAQALIEAWLQAMQGFVFKHTQPSAPLK